MAHGARDFDLLPTPPESRAIFWRPVMILILLLPWTSVAADLEPAVVESVEFNETFSTYYKALDGYTPEDLRLELSETIEDALSAGSHLTRASLDYKTRQIETGLFAQLRGLLCGRGFTGNRSLEAIKLIAVRSVATGSRNAGVTFDPAELGMIAGVVVRLVQSTPRTKLCSGT